MPELPEVEVVRRGLAAHVIGRPIERVDVYHERAVRRHVAGAVDFAAVPDYWEWLDEQVARLAEKATAESRA